MFEEYDVITEESGLMTLEDEAIRYADSLSKKYKVDVQLTDTDEEYYSDKTLWRTVREGCYFVSREDPERTAFQTERMIKFLKFRMEQVNENRIKSAAEKSVNIHDKIEQIKGTYEEAHSGKTPSLREIATALTKHEVLSPRGKVDWTATAVKRIIDKSEGKRHL